MDDSDFQFISQILKQRSGLVLQGDKKYLVESRLSPIARKEGFANVDELIGVIRTKSSEALKEAVTEAMTTNESFFFRDKKPFDEFGDYIIPYLKENRPKTHKYRIWCSAASTGQEPYSIGMVLKEKAPEIGPLNLEILGTDLSAEVLEKARNGVYTQFEVQRGMPIQLLVKYFQQKGENWSIQPDIKAMVKYKQFNLLSDFKSFGKWDVIFCRNVLIYFDQPTKAEILKRMAACMAPDGILLLGAAETVLGVTKAFAPIQGHRGLYRVAEAAGAAAKPVKKVVNG